MKKLNGVIILLAFAVVNVCAQSKTDAGLSAIFAKGADVGFSPWRIMTIRSLVRSGGPIGKTQCLVYYVRSR